MCFLIGNVYEGFEHWKSLLALLCRSEETMRKRKELYLGLIAVLYHQLGEIPPDFFVDIVSQKNFLTSTLQVEAQFQLEFQKCWDKENLKMHMKMLTV